MKGRKVLLALKLTLGTFEWVVVGADLESDTRTGSTLSILGPFFKIGVLRQVKWYMTLTEIIATRRSSGRILRRLVSLWMQASLLYPNKHLNLRLWISIFFPGLSLVDDVRLLVWMKK
jgi:hypothetical protein